MLKTVKLYDIIFSQNVTVRRDKMGKWKEKRKEKRAEERKSILETRAEHDILLIPKLAKEEVSRLSMAFTLTSLIGPIAISFLYSLFTIDLSALVWQHLVVDVVATLALIITLFVLNWKLDVAQRVVTSIETDKAINQKQIETCKKEIKRLEKNQSFYASATQLIGQAMKNGQKNIDELSKVLVSAIYTDLSRTIQDDNITINLYELRNEKIKMILSATQSKYCERDSVNIPALFQYQAGKDIKDGDIQDYYCIKCIRGKIRARDGKYVISDWEGIVRQFKWDKWTDQEKEQILASKNREECIQQGFKYNQYFAFMIRRDDGIQIFFEIITNGETIIAPPGEINHVTHQLKEKYSPLISILWDISNFSSEKE